MRLRSRAGGITTLISSFMSGPTRSPASANVRALATEPAANLPLLLFWYQHLLFLPFGTIVLSMFVLHRFPPFSRRALESALIPSRSPIPILLLLQPLILLQL